MKARIGKLALVAAVAVLGALPPAAEARELKLGHSMTEEQAQHKGMVKLAELVKQMSGGDLTIRIFPNGQLGSEREQAEQLVTGALDMAKINGSLAESFEPAYKVMGIPFLFRDEAHMKAFMRSDIAWDLMQSSKGKGFVGLSLLDAGSRSFYAKKPILKPSDLDGLKMRVPESPTMMSMVKLFGGQPTPMSWSEIYTGLQQGIIDGAENSVSSIVEMRHAEIAKHYSYDQHTMTPDVILISEDTWDTLTPKQQGILREAAKQALEAQIGFWEQGEAANIEKAKAMGVVFHEVDKAPFREKTRPILDAALKDPTLGGFVRRIQALK